MKILPLAKIAAAKKRLIEKETTMKIEFGAARTECGPSAGYRLIRKLNGELVLQAMFQWQEGTNGGFVWRDIPTVIEGESDDEN